MSVTKIKMCGLRRKEDIEYANILLPEYIGFVFAKKSRRFVTPDDASVLKKLLSKQIKAVGVFVDETIENIAELADSGIIDMIQLHGSEDDDFIAQLRTVTNVPIIKAFVIKSADDASNAESSKADYILLDSGKGSGELFDHSYIKDIGREYFLAGGLTPENVGDAVNALSPFAVDASSSLETDGFKDFDKMKKFISSVRKDG